MAKIRKKCWIENIEETGDCGFYIASISLLDHGDFMTVIGGNLDECVERAIKARDAFNKG